MVAYSRNIRRLMLASRWVLLLFVALDLLYTHTGAAPVAAAGRHATNDLSPAVLLAIVGAWTAVASLLVLAWGAPARSVVLAAVDLIVAVVATIGAPKSSAVVLLYALPVLEMYSLSVFAGLGTAVFAAILHPGLLLATDKNPGLSLLLEDAWSAGFMFLVAVAGTTYQSLQRQEAQTGALVSVIETSQELGTTASLEKILSLVIEDVKQLFDCTTCVIYLKEPDPAGESVIRVAQASTPAPEAFTDFNPELMHSIVGQVLKEKKGRVVGDFQTYQPEDTIKQSTMFRGTMVCPLLFEDEAIGAIFVSHLNPDVYNDSLFRLFSMLTTQVALAVRNVQLHKTTATLAITDSLSGLFTHGYFQEHLGKTIIECKYAKQPVSLMIIDVDFFKKVNDSYGHPQGDALLKQLGGVIKQVTRPTDVVCRYGGDEFTVTMVNTNRISAVVIAERIRSNVEDHEFILGNQIVHVTVSGGVASFPEDAETKKELVEKADSAMYEAKHKGRNKVCFSA